MIDTNTEIIDSSWPTVGRSQRGAPLGANGGFRCAGESGFCIFVMRSSKVKES